jgi:hypothetical protein
MRTVLTKKETIQQEDDEEDSEDDSRKLFVDLYSSQIS